MTSLPSKGTRDLVEGKIAILCSTSMTCWSCIPVRYPNQTHTKLGWRVELYPSWRVDCWCTCARPYTSHADSTSYSLSSTTRLLPGGERSFKYILPSDGYIYARSVRNVLVLAARCVRYLAVHVGRTKVVNNFSDWKIGGSERMGDLYGLWGK